MEAAPGFEPGCDLYPIVLFILFKAFFGLHNRCTTEAKNGAKMYSQFGAVFCFLITPFTISPTLSPFPKTHFRFQTQKIAPSQDRP
jgi:hypothetical protein